MRPKEKIGEDWRAMVRLPLAWGQRVDELAAAEMTKPAVLLRRFIKEGVERAERQRRREQKP